MWGIWTGCISSSNNLSHSRTMPITRTCRISGKEFTITDEDLAFYENISPIIRWEKFLIPPPTLCPEERLRRRLSWRGMYHLYRSKCTLTGKDIITVYPPNRPYQPVDQATWWSDRVENLETGREYDFETSFMSQYDLLLKEAYLPCLSNEYTTNQNSDYVQGTSNIKDCYLIFNASESENCEYCESIGFSRNCFDSYFIRNCDQCYDSIWLTRCHTCISLEESEDCRNVDFSYNMKWCSDCLLSFGQSNQKYLIHNKQFTQEAYFEEKKKYQTLHNGYAYPKLSELFEVMKQDGDIEKIINYGSENITGNHLSHCSNVHFATDVVDSKNCKYINTIGKWEDVYDCFSWWYTLESSYECVAVGSGASDIIGSYAVWSNTSRMYYCFSCIGCSDCLGCVWLKNKSYCIFNSQYTKEVYEELVAKIIGNMIRDGEWGEYLSPTISPWGYTETMAMDYFPLSKHEAGVLWYGWNDYEPPKPEATKYIPASRLPENISDIPDDILDWAIECEVSGKYYKLTRPELEFYRKHHLPIPRKHYDIRRQERFSRRFH